MRYAPKEIKSIDDLKVDTIYVNDETSEAVVTPDGVGFYYYDTEEQAMNAHDAVAEDCFRVPSYEYEAMLELHQKG